MKVQATLLVLMTPVAENLFVYVGRVRSKSFNLRSQDALDYDARVDDGIIELVKMSSRVSWLVKVIGQNDHSVVGLVQQVISVAQPISNDGNLPDNGPREDIKSLPRLPELQRLFQTELLKLYRTLRTRKPDFHIRKLNRWFEPAHSHIKLEIEAELFTEQRAPAFLAIMVDLRHCASISHQAAAKSQKTSGELLPLAQIECYRCDRNNADRSCYARPFNSVHSSTMPSWNSLVERAAA